MAEVFLARQEGMAGLRRLTVIKKILPQLSEVQDVAEMLLDEARIAAQLTHPNIVQIYELGQEEGQYFIAMEFVDGCDLATLARIERHRESRIPLRLTLRVLSEAAMALDYAHRQVSLDGRPLNLVHRDVSPHNVLCSRDGAVKVTDFGISKFAGKHQLTQVGVVKGKVQYMSPEQYRGAAVDHRSDIFSMGVVLYQLTVGKLPRVTESGQVAIKRVVEGTIPRPTSLRSEYPEELEDIVMRALANNPDERYPDAAALRDDLLEFAREHDLLAFPKELGEYVNTLVPPSDLVVHEKSVIGVPAASAGREDSGPMEPQVEDGRPLPSVIVEELASEAAPHTKMTSSIGRHRKPPPASLELEEQAVEQNTDIPITDSAIEESRAAEASELAVLPDEDLTPFPDDPEPYRQVTPPRPYRPPRREQPQEYAPTPVPQVTDQIRLDREPEPEPAPLPQTEPRLEPVAPPVEPPPPRAEGKAGAGAWVVALLAVLVAAGSLAYVFLGDRLKIVQKPTARPAVKPKLGAGVIHLHSNPSESSVSIDGAKRCFSTPCRVAGLPLGRELLLTLRAPGHSLWMQRVVLTAHQPKLLLRADLTPLSGYKKPAAKGKGKTRAKIRAAPPRAPRKGTARRAPATPRKKSAAAARRPPASAAKRKPAARPGKARKVGKNITITNSGSEASVLAIDVRPWAEVWVNGRKVGYTPIVRQIPPGKYKISLKNPSMKYDKTYPITVKKGKKVKIADVIAPPGQ